VHEEPAMSDGLKNFLTALTVIALYLAFCAEYTRTEDPTDEKRKDA
jgi:hypothetical protein